MGKEDAEVSRRIVVKGIVAASAELAVRGPIALAQEEGREVSESRGTLDDRQLDEYAEFLKSQSNTLSKSSPRNIVRLLSGVPTIWNPEQHTVEDRKLVYGPFSEFLDARDSKKLPVIPFRDRAKTRFYNLTRTGENETLTSGRMEYLASGNKDIEQSLKQGVDVVVRKLATLGEYESVPTLHLTAQGDSDLHCTRATLVGLAYTHKEKQEREERQPVFISGIILSHQETAAFSKMVVQLSSEKEGTGLEKEILGVIAKNSMIFLPSLGHESVYILVRSESAAGAPLLNAHGELVGILSDTVRLSYLEDDELIGKTVFLIQGPDNIRRAQKGQ